MRKVICLSITIAIVMIIFIGCTTKSLPTSVVGQWNLDTITNINGEILVVGKGYNDYDDFNGQKKDILATFSEDGTFEIEGSEERLQGDYYRNKEHSTADAIAINMNFNSGTKAEAVFGIRQYEDDKEVSSLLFTFNDKIYSFIKSADI